ncbi:ferric reductase-like transmembrane domain-containing protein [Subtercola endophyticus]|uniref:ferric reductase-like transmembrane domain-containing protein n=1 Tax=Subtercola endophyticus TaxID=2895559 RepID=UPI001E2A8B8A|nr:ferric reductase-like transmembrane domain-containing protein [Subtercola endophyticus]UFS60132.1 ferric reductase-like transmembrane domain-containing protein [Subtercola endophyticus]
MDAALWAIGRGTGVVGLVALTLAVLLGILTRSGRPLPGLPRFSITLVHRNLSLVACVFVLIHIVSLFFDSFAQLTLLDFVVPFFGSFLPFWQGLGTVAVDLLIAVTVTALLRNRIGLRAFRLVHWLTYAMWPIALAHAIGNGTDGTSPWFLWLAGISTLAVVAALAWRVSARFVEFQSVRTGETS